MRLFLLIHSSSDRKIRGQRGFLLSNHAPSSSSWDWVKWMLKSKYDRCSLFVKEEKTETLILPSASAFKVSRKWKVAGLTAHGQTAWQECVHDQEAPVCTNGRCGEADWRGTKGMHNTWNKNQATELGKVPNRRQTVDDRLSLIQGSCFLSWSPVIMSGINAVIPGINRQTQGQFKCFF